MRLAQAVLVIVDISGYTEFITKREVSLLHAEQVISELLEGMISRVEHPLVLNKLEGDAAFFYCETGGESGDDTAAAVRDVMLQLRLLFEGFTQSQQRISEARSHCDCGGCANVKNLRLKGFAHHAEVAIKQLRQFEELAGEGVILIHRLLKNGVDGNEYLLLTEPVVQAWPQAAALGSEHREAFPGVGELRLRRLSPAELPAA
jgi:hypothetical protein